MSGILLKVLVLGDERTGKSCLVHRYCNETFTSTYNETASMIFELRILDNIYGKTVKVQVWDTPGCRRGFYQYRKYAMRAKPGAYIFLYDVTNRQSFNNLDSYVNEYITNGVFIQPVDFILLGTKTDLEEQRMVSTDEAKQFAEKHSMDFLEVSALQNVGIEEAFDRLVTKLMVRSGETVASNTKSARTIMVGTQQICSRRNIKVGKCLIHLTTWKVKIKKIKQIKKLIYNYQAKHRDANIIEFYLFINFLMSQNLGFIAQILPQSNQHMEEIIATFKHVHCSVEFELVEEEYWPVSIKEWPADFKSFFRQVGQQSLTSTPVFLWNLSLFFPKNSTYFVQQLLDEERNYDAWNDRGYIDWFSEDYEIVWEQQFAVCHSNPVEGFCLLCIKHKQSNVQKMDVIYYNVEEKIVHPFQTSLNRKPREGIPSCHLALLQWSEGSDDRFSVWLNKFNKFTILQQQRAECVNIMLPPNVEAKIYRDPIKLEYHYKIPANVSNPKMELLVTRIKSFFQFHSDVIFTRAPPLHVEDCVDFTDFCSSLGKQEFFGNTHDCFPIFGGYFLGYCFEPQLGELLNREYECYDSLEIKPDIELFRSKYDLEWSQAFGLDASPSCGGFFELLLIALKDLQTGERVYDVIVFTTGGYLFPFAYPKKLFESRVEPTDDRRFYYNFMLCTFCRPSANRFYEWMELYVNSLESHNPKFLNQHFAPLEFHYSRVPVKSAKHKYPNDSVPLLGKRGEFCPPDTRNPKKIKRDDPTLLAN